MWRATYRDWETGSDLALVLLKQDAAGRLAQGRQWHLGRRVHLHSNRLGLTYLDEGNLYLPLAIGYLKEVGISDQQNKDATDKIIPAINQAKSTGP